MARLKKRLLGGSSLDGRRVSIRLLREQDATTRYCSWLNDGRVTQYTEARYRKTTMADLRKYLAMTLRSPSNFFFAIIENQTGEHIGNIKLESVINPYWDHRVGEVGLMIGEKRCWGKGFGTEAIRLVTEFGFRHGRLQKLTATCLSVNKGSARAFLKAGYQLEATRRDNARFGGKQVDLLLFGAINPRIRRKPR